MVIESSSRNVKVSISVEALNALVPKSEYGDFAKFEFDEELGMYVGDVVHHEFTGVAVAERQRRIWELIRKTFGEDAQEVSLVLTFSPAEWQEVGEDAA
jgi:hypothetical protein